MMIDGIDRRDVFVYAIVLYGDTRRMHMQKIKEIRRKYCWYVRHVDVELPIDKKYIMGKEKSQHINISSKNMKGKDKRMNNLPKTVLVLDSDELLDLQQRTAAQVMGKEKLDTILILNSILEDRTIGKYFKTTDIAKISISNRSNDVLGVYKGFMDGISNVLSYDKFIISEMDKQMLQTVVANINALISGKEEEMNTPEDILVKIEKAAMKGDEEMLQAIDIELSNENNIGIPDEEIVEIMSTMDEETQEEFAEAVDTDNNLGGYGPIHPEEEPTVEEVIEIIQDIAENSDDETAEELYEALNSDIEAIEKESGKPIFDDDELIHITEEGDVLPSPTEMAEDLKEYIKPEDLERFKEIMKMESDEAFVEFFANKFREDIFFDAITYILSNIEESIINSIKVDEEPAMFEFTADNRFKMTKKEMETFLRFIDDAEWVENTEHIGEVSTLDFYMTINEMKDDEEVAQYIKENGMKAYAEVNRLEVFVDGLSADMKHTLYPPIEYEYAYKTLHICEMLQKALIPYIGEYQPMVYIAGDMLNKGSILVRNQEAEDIRSIGYKVYSPIEDKEINDKSSQTEESNNGLAEKIVRKDTQGIIDSDIIVIEPAAHAFGTMCELGQIKGMKDVASMIEAIILGWIDNDSDENAHEVIRDILNVVTPLKYKKVYAHIDDIRATDIPEAGWRRSFAVNQYIHGVVLDVTDGRGFQPYEEILENLKAIANSMAAPNLYDDFLEDQAEIERQQDEAVEHEVIVEEE